MNFFAKKVGNFRAGSSKTKILFFSVRTFGSSCFYMKNNCYDSNFKRLLLIVPLLIKIYENGKYMKFNVVVIFYCKIVAVFRIYFAGQRKCEIVCIC